MNDELRTQIILAAVQAAGTAPPIVNKDGEKVGEDTAAWSANVSDYAARITAMTAENSQASKTINGVANSRVFTGTILRVEKQESSTRGVVTLDTGYPSKFEHKDFRTKEVLPDGHEQIRTDRTDNHAGAKMARRASQLVGHRVAVWVESEPFTGGRRKVRVLRHIEDLGIDKTTESD